MKTWIPIIGAVITSVVVNLVGVLMFFQPIAQADNDTISMHPAIGLLVYVVLGIWLFVWTSKHMKSVYKAAAVVALSQFILVIDLMMRGERGLLTALAGGVLLAVTWASIAFVYRKLLDHIRGTDAV